MKQTSELQSNIHPDVTFHVHYGCPEENSFHNGWGAYLKGKDLPNSCDEIYPDDKEQARALFVEGNEFWKLCMKDPMNAALLCMKVNGNRLELPKGNLGNYKQLKALLEKAGGKYSKNGFTFEEPAQDIKDMLLRGEEKNDKKKYQAFFTSTELAEEVVEMACIDDGDDVLEPEAGGGALATEILKQNPKSLTCVEIWDRNADKLKEQGFNVHNRDFLELEPEDIGMFDTIVANPPFTKNQDIDHVLHMHKFLKQGGRLVSIMSCSWREGNQKKHKEFRDWLQSVNGEIIDIESGAFKESGTNIATCYIIVRN